MILGLNIVIIFRLILAIILGGIIGLERELTNKYAGLRTNLLVCLGSCIFTILSIYAFPLAADNIHPQAFGDPARIAAQILTGIGFIGGGTVLRHGSSVYGLTTAATLWVAAAIGMACGTGMLALAIIGTFICVAVLVGIRYFERNILSQSTKNYLQLEISAICNRENAENIHKFIIDNMDNVHKVSRTKDGENTYLIKASISANGKNNIQSLYDKLGSIEGIENLTIQENNE